MMILIYFFTFVVLYLTCSYATRRFGYEKSYWFFQACHLFAGFFVAAAASDYFSNKWAIFAVAFAVGILWESWELSIDRSAWLRTFLSKLGMTHGPFEWWDSMFDLVLDAAGAFLFILALL